MSWITVCFISPFPGDELISRRSSTEGPPKTIGSVDVCFWRRGVQISYPPFLGIHAALQYLIELKKNECQHVPADWHLISR